MSASASDTTQPGRGNVREPSSFERDDPSEVRPLTPSERATVHRVLEKTHPNLAVRVGHELDGDPVARAVDKLADSLTAEFRQLRWQTLVVLMAAMSINAAIVGVGVRYAGPGGELSTYRLDRDDPREREWDRDRDRDRDRERTTWERRGQPAPLPAPESGPNPSPQP
jgi:hypothetical protein